MSNLDLALQFLQALLGLASNVSGTIAAARAAGRDVSDDEVAAARQQYLDARAKLEADLVAPGPTPAAPP